MPLKSDLIAKTRRFSERFLPFHPVSSISVIVPTLNEAPIIERCISSVLSEPHIRQVIVADGGSSDQAVEIAKQSGASVVQCKERGRGIQIREAIQCSNGDVLLILHADCQMVHGMTRRMISMLNQNPFAAGGSFRMHFSSPRSHERVVSYLNNIRAVTTGISFGDQGQFFRREALDRIGGFPDQMLMEDVELSLRLKQIGKLVFLPAGIVVSGRRWKSKPFGKSLFQVFYLFFRYLIEREFRVVPNKARYYHNRYYR